jgi:hypothetical protein
MTSKQLKFTQIASAINAGASVIGYLSTMDKFVGAVAAMTFLGALYFQLRKPDLP